MFEKPPLSDFFDPLQDFPTLHSLTSVLFVFSAWNHQVTSWKDATTKIPGRNQVSPIHWAIDNNGNLILNVFFLNMLFQNKPICLKRKNHWLEDRDKTCPFELQLRNLNRSQQRFSMISRILQRASWRASWKQVRWQPWEDMQKMSVTRYCQNTNTYWQSRMIHQPGKNICTNTYKCTASTHFSTFFLDKGSR